MCIRNCTVREKVKNARSYSENSGGKRIFRKVVGSMFWVGQGRPLLQEIVFDL